MTSSVPRECPRCGNIYTEFPALSRQFPLDICPECGADEALRDALGDKPMEPEAWFKNPEGIILTSDEIVLTSDEIVLTSEEEAVQ